jgi:LAO/AO transport system kinase
MKEKLREEIMKKAVDRKLTCAVAREIAEDFGVPYSSVGAAADELGIKIKKCQLGCF